MWNQGGQPRATVNNAGGDWKGTGPSSHSEPWIIHSIKSYISRTVLAPGHMKEPKTWLLPLESGQNNEISSVILYTGSVMNVSIEAGSWPTWWVTKDFSEEMMHEPYPEGWERAEQRNRCRGHSKLRELPLQKPRGKRELRVPGTVAVVWSRGGHREGTGQSARRGQSMMGFSHFRPLGDRSLVPDPWCLE